MVRRDLGTNVPCNFIGSPYVPSDHINDRLVEHPLVIESYQRNEDTFLKDVMVVRSNPAADVGMMKYACSEGHKLFLIEDGAHDANVVEVTGQSPRIIGDEDVAGLIIICRKFVDEIFYSKGHST